MRSIRTVFTCMAAIGALAGPAAAQTLTELQLMVPASPGGGFDLTARAMQQVLIGSRIVGNALVTNVPGAGGTIGLSRFVGARGDGRQLMVIGSTMAGAIAINNSPVKLDQVTPIARLTEEYQVIVVPENSPFRNARDLTAAMKADVTRVTLAGGSAGGLDHITAILLANAAGADGARLNYVPFSGGGEALAAILSGKVMAGISGWGEYEGQIKAGKLRAIGVTAGKRIPGIDAATFREQGIDVEIANWRAVVAPPGISAEQKATLANAVDRMVKSDAWKQTIVQKGWDEAYLPGDAFASFIGQDSARTTRALVTVGLVAPTALAGLPAPPPPRVQSAAPAVAPVPVVEPPKVAVATPPPPSRPAPALPARSAPGTRVALVIGNSAYKNVPALPNPTKDAAAVGQAFRELGFQKVIVELNLSRERLTDVLRNFSRESENADWAVVYFAGHGIEMGGTNYLIPIDAKLQSDRDIDFEAVPIEKVMTAVDGAKKMRLVLLDACRDNPFATQMRRTVATRSIGRGFAQIEPEAGTLVVYAAKHGQTALDGDSGNSPFVSALINRMRMPGLEIRRLFDMVRDDVMTTTNRRQQPFSYGSVSGSEDFFFIAAK